MIQNNAMFVFRLVFFLLIAFSQTGVARAGLNDDKLVEKILNKPILMSGTLEQVVEKNMIPINGSNKKLDAVMAQIGLEPSKISVVESYAIMRWSVKRIRVSKKYEILMQFGINAEGNEEVIGASIIPHVETLMRHNLSNRKNWPKFKFPLQAEK